MHEGGIIKRKTIAVIGQGYVGLPLAIEFAHYFSVVGFDINIERIEELKIGVDKTQEADMDRFQRVLRFDRSCSEEGGIVCQQNQSTLSFNLGPDRKVVVEPGLSFSSDVADIRSSQIYIITVPTPVDDRNIPDLSPLRKVSEMIGVILKKGDIVI